MYIHVYACACIHMQVHEHACVCIFMYVSTPHTYMHVCTCPGMCCVTLTNGHVCVACTCMYNSVHEVMIQRQKIAETVSEMIPGAGGRRDGDQAS